MVTGDHPLTARAIAEQIGILDVGAVDSGSGAVVTGDNLRDVLEVTDPVRQKQLWDDIFAHDQLVFARVSPAHKLIICEEAQSRGLIVAVTGMCSSCIFHTFIAFIHL